MGTRVYIYAYTRYITRCKYFVPMLIRHFFTIRRGRGSPARVSMVINATHKFVSVTRARAAARAIWRHYAGSIYTHPVGRVRACMYGFPSIRANIYRELNLLRLPLSFRSEIFFVSLAYRVCIYGYELLYTRNVLFFDSIDHLNSCKRKFASIIIVPCLRISVAEIICIYIFSKCRAVGRARNVYEMKLRV